MSKVIWFGAIGADPKPTATQRRLRRADGRFLDVGVEGVKGNKIRGRAILFRLCAYKALGNTWQRILL